jgi:hypothetical protein
MNFVSFALRRPISLLTVVVATALVGFLALGRMSRDIFPDLGMPGFTWHNLMAGMDSAQTSTTTSAWTRPPHFGAQGWRRQIRITFRARRPICR